MNELLKSMISNNIIEKNSFSNNDVRDLYILVDNYIKNTGICITYEYGKYYIKQDSTLFEVGVDWGPDLFYYVRMIDSNELDDFIDINDIYNNVISVRQAIIKNEIKEIKERIKYLEEEKGLSRKLIKKYINL